MSLSPGFLVVDKPAGLTSHDVVAMIRAVTGVKKVGHTGTLDPFATGVLPLALGSATRLIRFLDERQKVYDATIALGVATDTGDPTGTAVREAPVPVLEPEGVTTVLQGFLGDRMQVPPRYSAVKVRGRRLYDYARHGEEVVAEARPIHIFDVTLLHLEPGEVRVLLTCSRGTYARVLADEIACALGTAGHLRSLTRRRSGPFTLEQAIRLEELSTAVAGRPDWAVCLRSRSGGERVPWAPRATVQQVLSPRAVSVTDALSHLPLLVISTPVRDVVLRGGKAPPPPIGVRPGAFFLLVHGDEVVGVAEARPGGHSQVLWRDGEEDDSRRTA